MIKLPRVGPRPNRRSKRRRIALGLLAALAVGFAGLDLWSRKILLEELAAVESTGQSVSLEEQLSPGRERQANASDALNAACALVRLDPGGTANLRVPEDLRLDQPLPKADPALLAILRVPEYRLALETLDLSRNLTYARYLPWSAESPGLSALQGLHAQDRMTTLRLARILHLRAYSRVAAEQPQQAYEDLLGLLRLAGWIHREMPVVLSWIMSIRFAEMALEGWEQLATHAPPSPDLRAELEAALANIDEMAESGGLLGERAFMFQLVQRTGEQMNRSDGTFGGLEAFLALFGRGYLRAQSAEYLRAYGALIEWSQMPPYGREAWETRYRPRPVFGFAAGIILRNMIDVVGKTDRLRARIDLARLAAAHASFAAETGETPRDIRQLVPGYLPSLPLDPWTGEPFVLIEDEASCRYISTGGGGDRGPLAWRVPCPSHQSG